MNSVKKCSCGLDVVGFVFYYQANRYIVFPTSDKLWQSSSWRCLNCLKKDNPDSEFNYFPSNKRASDFVDAANEAKYG